jgi:hypothetical protein
MLDQTQTALCDENDVVPSFTLGELKWIGQIIREYVPAVPDDVYQLEPRL